MSIYDSVNTVNAGFEGEKRPAPPQGRHLFVVESTEDFKNPKKNTQTLYKADLTLVEAGESLGYPILLPNGQIQYNGQPPQVGGQHSFVEQANGHEYESHAKASAGAIKGFVATCYGLDVSKDQEAIKAQIDGNRVMETTRNKGLLSGHLVWGTVEHKVTGKGSPDKPFGLLGKFKMFEPCLDANGNPRKVALPGQAQASTPPAMVRGPAPAGYAPPPGLAPAPAPAPAFAAPAPAFPPPGWANHEGQFYRPNIDTMCITEAQLREKMAKGQA